MKQRSIIIICLISLLFLQACGSKDPIKESEQEQLNRAWGTLSPMPSIQLSKIIAVIPSFAPEEAIPLSRIISQKELAKYFEKYDNATILITDGVSQVAYNESFSKEQHSPYSTFKIPNSLIALEERVVSTDNSLRKWDGVEYNREELNQDQDMASAFKHSCVWYYKQLANEIGSESMQRYINDIGYGNMDISGGVDEFWLGSSMLISPKEQLDFMIRLYKNELPFETDNMNYVKSIMKQEGYSIDLYGKTGSSGDGMGWFVGYSLLNGKPIFFVTYIEGDSVSGLIARDLTAQIINDFIVD